MPSAHGAGFGWHGAGKCLSPTLGHVRVCVVQGPQEEGTGVIHLCIVRRTYRLISFFFKVV